MTNDKDGAALLRDLVMAMERMEPEALDMFRLEPGVKLLREWIGKAPTAALKSHGQAFDAAAMRPDPMVQTARRNLKMFVSGASFRCLPDKDAALACIEVLGDRIDGLENLVTVLRSAFAAQEGLNAAPQPAFDAAGVREACAKVAESELVDVFEDSPEIDTVCNSVVREIASAIRALPLPEAPASVGGSSYAGR